MEWRSASGVIFFPDSDPSVYKNGQAGYDAVKAADLEANGVAWLTPANRAWMKLAELLSLSLHEVSLLFFFFPSDICLILKLFLLSLVELLDVVCVNLFAIV